MLASAHAPRRPPPGYVYYALNRAAARLWLFRKAADYAAFLRVLDAQRPRGCLYFESETSVMNILRPYWYFSVGRMCLRLDTSVMKTHAIL